MIKFRCKEGESQLELNGTLPEIEADIAVLVRNVYEAIKEKSDFAADAFKDFCRDELQTVPFMSNDEIKKMHDDKKREVIQSINDEIEELFNKVRSAVDECFKEDGK